MIASSTRLAGEVVVDDHGEDVGRLERVMIDVASGRVAYVVLACGGVFGIGERRYGVAWKDLRLDPERRCFVLGRELADLERSAAQLP